MAYREPGLVHATPPDFSRAWRRYRRLRRLLPGVLLVPLLSMIAMFMVEDHANRDGAWFWLVEVALWMALLMMLAALPAFVYCIVRLVRWPCPNCGQAFFRGQDLKQSLRKRKQCLHCGLSQWAKSPPLDEMPLIQR